MPSAKVKIDTFVLCVISIVENAALCPCNLSWVADSSRATRSDGVPARCGKGMITLLASGSKCKASAPKTMPTSVIQQDTAKDLKLRRKVCGNVLKNHKSGRIRYWRSWPELISP